MRSKTVSILTGRSAALVGIIVLVLLAGVMAYRHDENIDPRLLVQTYQNTEYGFSLVHPARLTAGGATRNSVLGTVDEPVPGIYVGPLVLVVLDNSETRQEAREYMDLYITQIEKYERDGPFDCSGVEGPCSTEPLCSLDRLAQQIEFLECEGEGGYALYAYVRGPMHDIFVDGYSRGAPATGDEYARLGRLTAAEVKEILRSLRFQ